ncbi:uncharacterized protein ELE39_000208 [Cryptosporidium sp. chipmunk genotype I]|uniref:uncharacterized protein n=1 Tax=Cryptosporidium sp. chipmunk genotype I TaxID=1280935 RepID=UPI003519FAF9|nr:hypothetical protein ELE39_000208 [Cryptosporidium sp. chipmunk genotype I]
MDLMELALRHGVKRTPNGPFLYPLNVRGRKPFSLLTDDESSNDSDKSLSEEENLGMGAKVKCIYDNDLYKKHDSGLEEENEVEPKKRIQETIYEYKSKREGKEVEYISREDAFEIQYAKDFEFFFGVPYRPYIRLSRYRFGKNMKYPRDLKQEEAVYKKYPRYFFNDPWPDIDVSKPIPYVKQKQPPKLVNERGIPIAWLDIIEKSKRYNVRRGNKSAHNLESQSKTEPPRTLGDAVVAWEVSSSLLNGDLPSIIGEDKRSRKQKRFSFVRDNIRGVAEEIESWTKCPVVQTEINKYLESSWKNIEKQLSSKPIEEQNEKKLSRSGSKKSVNEVEGLQKTFSESNRDLKSKPNNKSNEITQSKVEPFAKEESKSGAKLEEKETILSTVSKGLLTSKDPPALKGPPPPKGPPAPSLGSDVPAPKGPPPPKGTPAPKGPPPPKGPPAPSSGSDGLAPKGPPPPKGPPAPKGPPPPKGPPAPSSGSDGLAPKGPPPPKGPPAPKGPPPPKDPPLPKDSLPPKGPSPPKNPPPSKGPPPPSSNSDGSPAPKNPPPLASKGPPPPKGPPATTSKGPPTGKGPPLPKKAPPPKKG